MGSHLSPIRSEGGLTDRREPVPNRRALAVDDETVSRLVLTRMLVGLGFDVTDAADAPEAVEALAAESFDIVVTDYLMPSGTGLDVAGAAKKHDLPVILLTGFGHASDLPESSAELVDVHLTKPVSSEDLAEVASRFQLGPVVEESTGHDTAADRADNGADDGADDGPGGAPCPALAGAAATLLPALGVEVTLLDETGRFIGGTNTSRAALGYDADRWTQLNVFDLVHPDEAQAAHDALTDVLDKPGEMVRARFRALHRHGHWENVEMRCTNLLDHPDVGALVVTSFSVTAEEELRTAHEEQLKQDKLQREYVASVSHELRSPLQGILGVAQLLEEQVSGEPAELVAIIRTEAARLRRVIDDILDYAKAGQGAMELNPAPTSVRKLASDVVDICRPQIKPGVQLVTDIAENVPDWILVDELRLHQILVNLTANAARFTESGSITITCRPVRGDRYYFSVADTGTGISPEDLSDLFEPFRQGLPAGRNGGTGLGLAVCKRLISLMEGRLEVQSTLAEGSTFSFGVAAETADAPAQDGPVVPARDGATVGVDGTPATPKALVVDDGEVNRLVIGRQLESMGFEVAEAFGGAEGLQMALDSSYDVVVSDWHMPEFDGLDLIAGLRESESDPGRPHTPVVIMTASAMVADRNRCLEAGADGFLAKPATRQDLFEVVGRYLTGAVATGNDRPDAGSSPQEPESPTLEPEVLDRLVEELGDQSVLASVVETFLDGLDDLAAGVATGLATGDHSAAAWSAHSLKGPSQMLGAARLGELCKTIETDPDHNVTTDRLDRSVAETRDALRQWLSSRQEKTA